MAAGGLHAQENPAKSPLLVLLEGDVKVWQDRCGKRDWQFLAPGAGLTGRTPDERALALQNLVRDTEKRLAIDPERVYLAGQGEGAAAVFFFAARTPDLWAAAVALGGSPKPAIETNRLFAANTSLVPVLWLSGVKEDQEEADKLKAAGYNLEYRYEQTANPDHVLDWLGQRHQDAFPAEIDCETNAPAFSRCYWIEVTRFDPHERNDVLTSSHIEPVLSASLAAGPFGYKLDEPGPGVLISWLPENYKGPLKLNDRIVAIGGKALADAREFTTLMQQTKEEKPVVIMVERGKDRVRVETSIVVPQREIVVSARVQGRYDPEAREVLIISRAIAAMRVRVPEQWTPGALNWNGTDVARLDGPGCWVLSLKNEVPNAGRCP